MRQWLAIKVHDDGRHSRQLRSALASSCTTLPPTVTGCTSDHKAHVMQQTSSLNRLP